MVRIRFPPAESRTKSETLCDLLSITAGFRATRAGRTAEAISGTAAGRDDDHCEGRGAYPTTAAAILPFIGRACSGSPTRHVFKMYRSGEIG